MTDCFNEIIGLNEISLYKNDGVRLTRPDVSVEDEVNLTATYEDGDSVILEMRDPKWKRVVSYSKNYRQNFFDEFTFLLHGIETEIPEIVKAMRANRVGFIIAIKTIGNKSYVFPDPVFLNAKNTKKINSHSWDVSLSYRTPTFMNRLTLLSTITNSILRNIESPDEVQGVKALAFYINDDVRINRPDPSVENEVDIIAHSTGSFIIGDTYEYPKWERSIEYSENYKEQFTDKFTFILNGIENDVPLIIESMRNNRLGYVTEVVTTGNRSYVFPAPVFLDMENTKKINSHSWSVSLGYRVPTFQDRLIKLNTILMAYNYILGGDNSVLGGGGNEAITG